MKFKMRIFSWIRIILYFILFVSFIIIPTSYFINNTICHFHNITGYLCPTCGVTRAFSSILHFNIINAFSYHPLFTILVFPISLFVIIQDTFSIIKREINKENIYSLLEAIFLGKVI